MMNESGLMPLGYRVVVEVDERKKTTDGGIILPDDVSEREEMAQMEGVIVAKGMSAWDGVEGIGAEIGNRVLFAKYAGYLHIKGERRFRVVNDDDIVAIIGANDGS